MRVTKAAIKKLRLRDGDILLVRDHETLDNLAKMMKEVNGVPNCPIVIAPGGVHRLSKGYLKKLFARP